MYKIRLANNGKEFSHFNKAWHHKFLLTSDSSATEVDEPKNKKQSSQAPKTIHFNMNNTDSEPEEGYNILELSTAKNTHSALLSTANSNQKMDCYQTLKMQKKRNFEVSEAVDDEVNIHQIPFIQNNSILETIETTNLQISNNNLNKEMIKQRSEYDSSASYNTYENLCLDSNDSTSNLRLNYSNKDIMLKLDAVSKEQDIQRLMMERLLLKIDAIAEALKNKNGLYSNISVKLDEDFYAHFPLNDAAMFNLVENRIINNSNFLEKLEFFIKSIGGCDPKDHIKRTLTKLFNNEYAIKCTWTGRGKDIITKIGSTEFLKVIKKIIKECGNKLITDADYEKCVSDWFRYANTRLNRSKLKLVAN